MTSSLVQPTLLAFDCLGAPPSYALKHKGVVYEGVLKDGLSQTLSCDLIPALQAICEEAGISLSQVQGLATLTGPGSFTGIRLGLATLIGLKVANSCFCFTPNRLDLWAFSRWIAEPESIGIALSTHRQDYFFQWTTPQFMLHEGPSILTRDDILARQEQVPYLKISGDDPTLNSSLTTTVVSAPPTAKTLIEFYDFSLTYNQRALSGDAVPFYLRSPVFTKQNLAADDV